MFRLFFSVILFFFISLQIEAQMPGTQDRGMIVRHRAPDEQIQKERIAYFTEAIGLTSEEAQVFWPIYNEMENKRTALFDERASIIHKFMNEPDKLSDKQIDEHLNRLIAIQQKEMALPAEYDARFRKALSALKVMNLYVAEMGFRNYLLQKMRNERSEKSERK